ncbi:hypothetical protein TNCV_3384501 [Trichonephila clavipes]|uniref:Uncharacterized protein n=1 Tax=Trichonephila clavipes TaxID=2585209 RepID=A0A8X6SQ97_TRICX|nr:hypothetical protein TNCV_3384501 [Trichonephila clavipes]
MKRKENFQMLPKELHQQEYEATSVTQGSVLLVKKTQERKSSTCYLLITKDVTSSSPVPLKTHLKNPEDSKLAISVHQHDHNVTKMVAKNEEILALLTRFRQVPIQSSF